MGKDYLIKNQKQTHLMPLFSLHVARLGPDSAKIFGYV